MKSIVYYGSNLHGDPYTFDYYIKGFYYEWNICFECLLYVFNYIHIVFNHCFHTMFLNYYWYLASILLLLNFVIVKFLILWFVNKMKSFNNLVCVVRLIAIFSSLLCIAINFPSESGNSWSI